MWALAACLFLGVPAILVVLCALGSRFQSRHVVVPVSPRGALPACNDGLWLALLSPVKRVPLPWLGLSPPQDPSYIPDLSVRATSVATDPAALVELLSVVGVEDTADPHAAAEAGTPTPHTRRPGRLPSTLPLLYFDVITFRLVLLLLAHGRLPWVLLGSVKTAVEVQQWTDVTLEDKHDYSACFVARRPHRRGTELDVRVEVRRTKDAVLVWHSTTSILFFHAVSHTVQKPAPRVPALPASRDPSAHHFVELAGDLGRRYAATCRDYNPIHMWNWSAKLFGFRRAMVHGMCLADMVVSRANRLADMTLLRRVQSKSAARELLSRPIVERRLRIVFKQPAYLGHTAHIQLWVGESEDGCTEAPSSRRVDVMYGVRKADAVSGPRRWAQVGVLTLVRGEATAS